jgi:RNA polymerase sigma-70 factor (ECF subfamily)
MGNFDTRPTLIMRIRDAEDSRAWDQFVEIYTPMVHAFCMRRGLQAADASDVVQETMRSVAGAIPRFEYDPVRGTFRSWMFTVARNKLNNYFRKSKRQPQGTGGTTMLEKIEQHPDGADEEAVWETEYRRQMFHWAADMVRSHFKEETWQAFWRTAVDDEPVDTVAAALGMRRGTVYVSRSRVIAKIRQTIESVAGEGDVLVANEA